MILRSFTSLLYVDLKYQITQWDCPDNFYEDLDQSKPSENTDIDIQPMQDYWIPPPTSIINQTPSSPIHILNAEGKNLVGTPRFCSINANSGREQSRRDDLESLGYVLIYLVKGRLPWQNIQGAKSQKQRFERILQKKIGTPVEDLCATLPEQFKDYFEHCRSLTFFQDPDYNLLIQDFQKLLK